MPSNSTFVNPAWLTPSPAYDWMGTENDVTFAKNLIEAGTYGPEVWADDDDLTCEYYDDHQVIWQRVGNFVFFWGLLSFKPTYSTGAGDLLVRLPFPVVTLNWSYYPPTATILAHSGTKANAGDLYLEANAGVSYAAFKERAADSKPNGTNPTVADVFTSGTAAWIQFNGMYVVAPGTNVRENLAY